MNIEQERAAFEAWFNHARGCTYNGYKLKAADHAWEAWLARAAQPLEHDDALTVAYLSSAADARKNVKRKPFTKEQIEQLAKTLAEHANTCCYRSDGFEELLQKLFIQLLLPMNKTQCEPLSEEQIEDIRTDGYLWDYTDYREGVLNAHKFARAIERAHGIGGGE